MAKLLVALLLLAGTAHAITISRTETRLEDVQVCIRKGTADPSFIVSFRTYDASGLVREVAGRDVWGQLNGTQQTQVRGVINAIYGALHTAESIPTPTPAQ
jgi:hypothetical protein